MARSWGVGARVVLIRLSIWRGSWVRLLLLVVVVVVGLGGRDAAVRKQMGWMDGWMVGWLVGTTRPRTYTHGYER